MPLMALETLRPRWCEPGVHAVLDRQQVAAMTDEAAAHGIRNGMRRAGVLALCPAAMVHDRNPSLEKAALDSIALALLQYTPEVAMAGRGGLLMDVTASLRAFGGRRALWRQVGASVLACGFTPRMSMAPTAQGAWLMSRSPAAHRRVIGMKSMACRLDALPCLLLPEAEKYAEWLQGVGCSTLGDLRRLPRAGLQRRCDPRLLEALDRAYGEAPELFEWVQAPRAFSSRLELPDRIEHAEAVLFAARRLLLQMTGWLAALKLAVSHFTLQLEHERGRSAIPPTPIGIGLAEPAWQEEHLVRLLRERLNKVALTAPVIALRLEANRTVAMEAPTDSLFLEPGGTPADYRRLLELLTARLGESSVLMPAPRADHRPEACNQWIPATTVKEPEAVESQQLERPFWMLEKPVELMVREDRPFYGSPLKTLTGPERIECGWWDGDLVVRDYYAAQSDEAVCYWIYRERIGEEVRWFLHGLFA